MYVYTSIINRHLVGTSVSGYLFVFTASGIYHLVAERQDQNGEAVKLQAGYFDLENFEIFIKVIIMLNME